MPIAHGPNGERWRLSFPYRGERFSVTRYAKLDRSEASPKEEVEEVKEVEGA